MIRSGGGANVKGDMKSRNLKQKEEKNRQAYKFHYLLEFIFD